MPSFVLPHDASLDAALLRCPTADEVAFVDSVMTLVFEADPTAPALVCTEAEGSADLTHFQERAYQAVLSISRIPFDAPLPWTDLTLWSWFIGEVNGITFRETELSYCCDGPGVLVIRSGPGIGALQSDLWIAPEGGMIYWVQLFLHEARHVAGFGHTCAGGADDATLEEGGAWAVVYWFFTWLADHAASPFMTPAEAAPDFYASQARALAEQTLNSRIGCVAGG